MWFMFVQFLTALVVAGFFYVASRYHGGNNSVMRWFGRILYDLIHINNTRLLVATLVVSLWTLEMVVVYTYYGLPESPAHAAYREVSSAWQQLEGNNLERAARWWTGKHGTINPPTPHESSSWVWFWTVFIGWVTVGVYLPIALRDEAKSFFARLISAIFRKKQLASGGSPSTPAPAVTSGGGGAVSPHKRFSPAWFIEYMADDVLSDLFMGLFKRR